MKFIIAKSTVLAGNKESNTINAAIASAFGLPAPHKHTDGIVELENEFENFSVTLIDGNYEFEMNDECVLKVMRLYAKTAKLIAPLVKAIWCLIEGFKSDAEDIESFIGQRKKMFVASYNERITLKQQGEWIELGRFHTTEEAQDALQARPFVGAHTSSRIVNLNHA